MQLIHPNIYFDYILNGNKIILLPPDAPSDNI